MLSLLGSHTVGEQFLREIIIPADDLDRMAAVGSPVILVPGIVKEGALLICDPVLGEFIILTFIRVLISDHAAAVSVDQILDGIDIFLQACIRAGTEDHILEMVLCRR